MPNRQPMPNAEKPKVLVLGDDDRNVLPIIRSLGRQGILVHVAWCPWGDPALKSRYLAKAHDIARYVPGESAWRIALNQLLEYEQFDLIIPATEGAVHVLQTHRDELRCTENMYLLDDEVFRVVTSKTETYQLATSLGIPCPESQFVSSDKDMTRLRESLSLPVIIKPCSSVRDSGRLTKHFVRTAYTADDAVEYLEYLAANGSDALLQDRFDGTGVGVELLASEGEILIAIQHQRLHETNGYGSTYRETMPVDDKLRGACEALMRTLNYTGLAMVEFRVDFETGEWILLEINGRCWGSLPLAVAAGADFPLYLYQHLVEGKADFPQDFRTGVRSRCLTNDVRWTWRRIRGKGKSFANENEGCLGWSVNNVSYWQLVKDILRGLTFRDHIDTFTWDDWAPARTEIFQLVAGSLIQSIGSQSKKEDQAVRVGRNKVAHIGAGTAQTS